MQDEGSAPEIDSAKQAEIDAITWYHEFDFPGGLKARTETPDKDIHRLFWEFITRNLDKLDFEGKTVLDIGCWDGYWSFYSEKRGAKSVLATDDVSQNWAAGTGLHLAKELYDSKIEINQGISVYDIASLNQRFDVVLCMGVYYHLYDPFYAFSQVRHCCHEDTIVVFEGDLNHTFRPYTAEYRFNHPSKQTFIPSYEYMDIALRACYFEILKMDLLSPASPLRWAKDVVKRVLRMPVGQNRAFFVCKPFSGENIEQPYKPPFGLAQYDPRYR